MRRSCKLSAVVVVLSLGVLASGCYGPFNLTKRLHHWNGEIEGEWAAEGVFVGLAVLQAYTLCTLGDAIVFNSIEFWGGENPIDPPMARGPAGDELDRVAALYGLPPPLIVSAPAGTAAR